MNNVNDRILIGYGVVSPLHLANLMSYYYTNPQTYTKIIICIYNYWGKVIVPEYYLNYLRHKGIEVIYTSSPDDLKAVVKKQFNEVDLVLVSSFNWRVLAKVIKYVSSITVIDEGLSSYRSYSSKKADNPNLKRYKILVSKTASKLITSAMKKKRLRFKMFDIKSLEINLLYKQGLFSYFEDLKKFNSIDITNIYHYTVLYCSQPWVELGVMTEKEYIHYINQIKLSIEKKGLNFMLKKHPAEHIIKYDNYKIKTLIDDRMLEEIFYTCKFKAIISKNSTSAFLIPALYGTNSYLTDMNKISSLGPDAEGLYRRYCRDFSAF